MSAAPFAVHRLPGGLAVHLGHGISATLEKPHDTPHRADLRVTDLSALAAMGVGGGTWLIRLGRLRKGLGTVIGQCPADVAAAVRAALCREAQARAMEARYQRGGTFDAGLPPVARRAPGTRHVGRGGAL